MKRGYGCIACICIHCAENVMVCTYSYVTCTCMCAQSNREDTKFVTSVEESLRSLAESALKVSTHITFH